MAKTSVKLDEEMMRKAKIIAAARGQSVIEYLEAIVAPVIQRDVEEELRKLAGEGVTHSAAAPAAKRPKAKGE